eukprot:6193941-Pleurochrysis_carterae.AAC.2
MNPECCWHQHCLQCRARARGDVVGLICRCGVRCGAVFASADSAVERAARRRVAGSDGFFDASAVAVTGGFVAATVAALSHGAASAWWFEAGGFAGDGSGHAT